ncbi:MAG TPA: HEAT repeat domain-containing protein [Ktedonobacterales bacterium]|nr:HEAT repeat domain-containing protein [Ktedonobacterales bacterium]
MGTDADGSNLYRLLADCQSGDPYKQVIALQILIDLRVSSAVEAILPLLASPDPMVREVSAEALGMLGQHERERIGPALLPLLKDEEAVVREEAAEALGALAYPGALESLKEVLREDPHWIVRAGAAEALGNYADVSVLAELDRALAEDEEPSVRAFAAYSLGLVAPPTSIPVLEAHLVAQRDWINVRSSLIGALYRLGAPASFEELLSVIETTEDDHAAEVVLSMIENLTEWHVPAALPADARRLRGPLETLTLRFPRERVHAKQVLAALKKLEGNP